MHVRSAYYCNNKCITCVCVCVRKLFSRSGSNIIKWSRFCRRNGKSRFTRSASIKRCCSLDF